MSHNSFGNLFKITTWGESHGKAIGVIIDGCPAGIDLKTEDINQALSLRAPGRNNLVSPRKEPDMAEIYSGIFENKTTGAPISIIIENKNHDSSQYENSKNLYRPGHANFTYLNKYGVFDHRGGGRASARETACRVAAGAVAQKILDIYSIKIICFLHQVGTISAPQIKITPNIQTNIEANPLFTVNQETEQQISDLIETAKANNDSLGGIVKFHILNTPIGLGEPVYQKLESTLAHAMLSIPASKGFEIGEGFNAALMQGSTHNDPFLKDSKKQSNHAGGTLGGISTGRPLVGQVAFRPTSSIKQTQTTLDLEGNETTFQYPESARHDPCVAVRAVPVVKSMLQLVLADHVLLNQTAQIDQFNNA